MKHKTRQALLTIDQIESIVRDCRSFAHLEDRSASDRRLWASTSNQDDRLYIRNNSRRIYEVIRMLAECAESIRRLASGVRPTLLEVGIGYGEVALSAVKAFPWFEVFGLEHPDRAFLSNSGYLAKMKNGGIKLVTSDMSNGKLPFDDSTFDVVLFCEVLEHVSPVEVPRIVAELSRILKAGGALVIASPNLTSLFNRAVFVSGGNIFTPAIPLDYAGRTYGHIRLYTTGELKGLASLAGLNVKCVRYNNSMLMSGTEKRWHTIVVKRLQAVLSALFPSLSANWTVVLSK